MLIENSLITYVYEKFLAIRESERHPLYDQFEVKGDRDEPHEYTD